MLKTSRSTESKTKPGKGEVGVDNDGSGDGSDNGGHNDGVSRSGDSNRNLLDVPKSMCLFAPLTSMLKTSSSTDSSISTTQITVEYDEVDSGGGKLVEKSSSHQKIVKSRKNSIGWKVAKVIGLEEH